MFATQPRVTTMKHKHRRPETDGTPCDNCCPSSYLHRPRGWITTRHHPRAYLQRTPRRGARFVNAGKKKKKPSLSTRVRCNAVIFFDSVISSSNKGFYLVTALRGLSLPEGATLSQTPHAHTFNDFLNVTECQAGGIKAEDLPLLASDPWWFLLRYSAAGQGIYALRCGPDFTGPAGDMI